MLSEYEGMTHEEKDFALVLFYLITGIVVIIRHFAKEKRESDVYYIVCSIILNIACCIGLLVYGIFTSGM